MDKKRGLKILTPALIRDYIFHEADRLELVSVSGLLLCVIAGVTLSITASCTKPVKSTGFLSDYSKLRAAEAGLRYVDMERLGDYSSFIVDPVVVYLHGVPQGARPDPAVRKALADSLHKKIIDAVSDRYLIVTEPAPGVAQLRIAITDIEKSSAALNALPTAISGMGLGGASMEAELLDAETGEQIGAVVQRQQGKKFSTAGMTEWGDAEAVMKEWAARFRKVLDEAHGY